jgi:hypothetical protein
MPGLKITNPTPGQEGTLDEFLKENLSQLGSFKMAVVQQLSGQICYYINSPNTELLYQLQSILDYQRTQSRTLEARYLHEFL